METSSSQADHPGEPGDAKDLHPYRRGLFNDGVYWVTRFFSRLVLFLFFDVETRGRERVPRRGPCLLATNHQSFLDPWLVGVVLQRQTFFVARESLFHSKFFGWLLKRFHCLPATRGSAASRTVLKRSIRVLESGESVLLFPEGTRSGDGRLLPIQRGIELIARRSRAPVIPVLVVGAHRVWPRQRKFPRLSFLPRLERFLRLWGGEDRRIRIIFGEPFEMGPKESADVFTERLAAAYRDLAIELGVWDEVAPADSTPGSETRQSSKTHCVPRSEEGSRGRSSMYYEKPLGFSRPRWMDSSVNRITPLELGTPELARRASRPFAVRSRVDPFEKRFPGRDNPAE